MAAAVDLAPMDAVRIMQLIPHRYPMLLLDRMTVLEPDVRAVGIKAVGMGDPFFQGHFPGRPIMPGVLIVEALAQTAGVHAVASLGPEAEGRLIYFMAIENAKFRRPVEPGMLLELEVEQEKARGAVRKYRGAARVDGQVMAEANFTAMIAEPAAGG